MFIKFSKVGPREGIENTIGFLSMVWDRKRDDDICVQITDYF